jgi:hypothetical protein
MNPQSPSSPSLFQRAQHSRVQNLSTLVCHLERHPHAEYNLILNIQQFIPKIPSETMEDIHHKLLDSRLIDTFKISFQEEIQTLPKYSKEWLDQLEEKLQSPKITSESEREIQKEIDYVYSRWKNFTSFAHQDLYKRLAEIEIYFGHSTFKHHLLKRIRILQIMFGKIKRLELFFQTLEHTNDFIKDWLDEAEDLVQRHGIPVDFVPEFMTELNQIFDSLKNEAEQVEKILWEIGLD